MAAALVAASKASLNFGDIWFSLDGYAWEQPTLRRGSRPHDSRLAGFIPAGSKEGDNKRSASSRPSRPDRYGSTTIMPLMLSILW